MQDLETRIHMFLGDTVAHQKVRQAPFGVNRAKLALPKTQLESARLSIKSTDFMYC